MKVFDQRRKQYGNLYGVYKGTRPQLIVFDPVLIKKVMIQDFDHFMNRPLQGFDHPLEQKMFFVWEGNDWRAGRATCSPTFSSGKIKAMTPLILESVQRLLDSLAVKLKNTRDCAKELQVKGLFRSYALHNIGKTMFGIEFDTYDWDSTDGILKTALMYLRASPFKATLSTILPKWFKLWVNFTVFDKQGLNALYCVTKAVVQERKKSQLKKNYPDFISIMTQNTSPDSDGRIFTDDKLIANSMLFLLAAIEASTTTLSVAAFLLCKHPEKQEKLYQEIVTVVQESKDQYVSSLESLNQMLYLNAVVDETIRLYPPATYTERRVSKEYNLETESGKIVNLPVDTHVIIPISSIHRDPQNYEEPDKFIPERFMPGYDKEIDSMTYLPFGHGPRHCIARRIALVNTKLALANLILKYKLLDGPHTPMELDLSKTNDQNLTIDDFFIKFADRSLAATRE